MSRALPEPQNKHSLKGCCYLWDFCCSGALPLTSGENPLGGFLFQEQLAFSVAQEPQARGENFPVEKSPQKVPVVSHLAPDILAFLCWHVQDTGTRGGLG